MELMMRTQVRMSKAQELRDAVNQRLSAVAQEIYELFERTIEEYEEELLLLRPKQQQTLTAKQYSDDKQQGTQETSAVNTKADIQIASSSHRAAILEQANTELLYIKEEPEKEKLQEKMEATYDDINQPTNSSPHTEDWTLKWELQGITSKTEGCDSYPVHVIQPDVDRAAQNTSGFSNSKDLYETEGQESSEKITAENETKSKLHQCGQCGKAYQHRPSLHRHILIHKEQKPFTCSVCQKGFSQKPYLTSHMRIHTGERPFSCPFCAKTFTNQSNVRQHLRVHTGEKPFVCSVCKVQFGCTKSLQTHMRIHTGEKPFCCPLCDRHFSQRTNLKSHIKSHSVEVMTNDGSAGVKEGQSKSAASEEQSEDYITVSI